LITDGTWGKFIAAELWTTERMEFRSPMDESQLSNRRVIVAFSGIRI